MKMTKRKANIMYAVIQALYFMNMAIIYNFASAYLLDRGFTNSQIGLLLGSATVVTVILQLFLAEFIARSGIVLGKAVAVLFACLALAAFALLLFPLKGIAFVIAIEIVFVVENTLQPSVNSLYRGYSNQGVTINFALCRGIGSAAYSFSTLFIGQYLRNVSMKYLPGFYLVPSVLLVILVLMFRAPAITAENSQQQKIHLFREYPHFTLFLVGVALLATSHGFSETFLLQIMTQIGGGVGNLGIALAISSVTEFPAMLAYRWLFKKFGNRRMMLFAGWMWCLKGFLIMFAPSIPVIYAAELLQIASYALYVPTSAKHIAHAIPSSEFLRGQALAGSAFTVGTLISTLLGGRLIDTLGIRSAAVTMQLCSTTGAIIFTVSILWSLRVIPSVHGLRKEEDLRILDSAGFVSVSREIPDIILDARNYTGYNPVGGNISGEDATLLLTKEAAAALKEVNTEALSRGYRLKLFHAYRPKSTVADSEQLMDFCRGSSVALTLFDMQSETELDMGSPFDVSALPPSSDFDDLTKEQRKNLRTLQKLMTTHGFSSTSEWWHYTLKKEPYPDTCFDFPVTALDS